MLSRILDLSSTRLALIAVVIFAFFEAGLTAALQHVSVPVYLTIRLIVMCMFLAFVSKALFGDRFKATVWTMNPLKLPLVHWVRAAFWLLSTGALGITMAVSSAQTFGYTWFVLHPLWTLLLAPRFGKKPSSIRRQFWPIALTIAGAIVFALASKSVSESGSHCKVQVLTGQAANAVRDALIYAAPIAAGLFFTLANLLTDTVKEHTKESSPTIAFYSAYLSIFLLPVVFGLFVLVGMPFICEGSPFQEAALAAGKLALLCVVVTIGVVFFTEAFAKPNADPALLATLDLTIVFFAALIGWAIGSVTLFGQNALVSQKGLGLLLIVAGAGWSAYEQDRKKS